MASAKSIRVVRGLARDFIINWRFRAASVNIDYTVCIASKRATLGLVTRNQSP